MIQIRKLTPPQIACLRESFRHLVTVGALTTTNSIATFRPVVLPGYPYATQVLSTPWDRDKVARLLRNRLLIDQDDRLTKVLDKVENRPEMVREV